MTSSFKTLNSGAILINILKYLALGLLLQLLELWPYPFKHSNAGLIFIHIGILTSSLQTLQFLPYLFTHWGCYLVVNLGTRALFLYTLEFWPHHFKYRNSGPIFMNIGIPSLSFQTLEFWPYFYTNSYSYPSKRLNSGPLFLHTLFFWSYPSKPSGPVSISTGIMILSLGILVSSFETLQFWPYLYTHGRSYLIDLNLGILALFLWTKEFSYPSKDWNSGPIFIHIGFLMLSFKTLGSWPYF